jgi:hypothetical protein
LPSATPACHSSTLVEDGYLCIHVQQQQQWQKHSLVTISVRCVCYCCSGVAAVRELVLSCLTRAQHSMLLLLLLLLLLRGSASASMRE